METLAGDPLSSVLIFVQGDRRAVFGGLQAPIFVMSSVRIS
jgi:hypothetical protein